MQFTTQTLIATLFLIPLAITAPTGARSALEPRQSNNAGSTSTSTSNPTIGLVGGSAAAAEDGQSTSSTSTSECNLIDCSSGASAAGPNNTAASTSSGLFNGLAKLLKV